MGLNGPLIHLPIPKTPLNNKKTQIIWFGKFQIGQFDF